MVTCVRCKAAIPTVFLEKIKGTYVKKDGKKEAVCHACQKSDSLLDRL